MTEQIADDKAARIYRIEIPELLDDAAIEQIAIDLQPKRVPTPKGRKDQIRFAREVISAYEIERRKYDARMGYEVAWKPEDIDGVFGEMDVGYPSE